MAFLILVAGITLALIIIVLTAILNVLTFPRLRSAQTPAVSADKPLVSILIPARNEAQVITRTIRSLLAQHYPNFEIILLDDQSTDGTADIAAQAGAGDSRLRIISGAPLPEGWLGKNWACQQLSQAAGGDYLIFTDADVYWSADALAAVMALAGQTRADLLTVWPTQDTVSAGERLVVPLMALAILGYLPLLGVHHLPWAIFAAANGQCMAFRRAAYNRVGGHAAVRDQIVEDVAFARRVKQAGLRLRMADGAGQICCRMYHDWPGVRAGFSKNILAGHGGSVTFLAVSTLFHWLIFVFPWAWLLVSLFTGAGLMWPLALIALGVGVRLLTAVATRQRALDALWLPFSVVLITIIAAQSVWWQYHGGPRWKGRVIASQPPTATTVQALHEDAAHG